jgi:hypothetical protein
MAMKKLLPTLMRVGDEDGVSFPLIASAEKQDPPSPKEEEDFCLRHCLRKYVKI